MTAVELDIRTAEGLPVRPRLARRGHAPARSRRGPGPHRPQLPGLGGRRRVQRRPRPAPVLRPADRDRHRVRRQRGRPALEDLILQGGVDTVLISWVPVRRHRPRRVRNGLNFTERGFGVRGARRRLRPRPHGGQPAAARRRRLGPPVRDARGRAGSTPAASSRRCRRRTPDVVVEAMMRPRAGTARSSPTTSTTGRASGRRIGGQARAQRGQPAARRATST